MGSTSTRPGLSETLPMLLNDPQTSLVLGNAPTMLKAPLSGMPTMHPLQRMRHFHCWGVTRLGAHQALPLTNPLTHLLPRPLGQPVTPDGARQSGRPWWLAALGAGSRVRQPPSGTTLLPQCLQGPSD